MELIRIADHVVHASSYEDGQVIYDLIAPKIAQGEPVEVSFDGIPAVPSAFINAAFLPLVDIAPMARIQQMLRIKDSTRYINELIKRRFAFITRRPVPAAS